MNAQLSSFNPFSAVLFSQSAPHPSRRRLVDDFPLDTGAVCVLGHEKESPAIVRWNA